MDIKILKLRGGNPCVGDVLWRRELKFIGRDFARVSDTNDILYEWSRLRLKLPVPHPRVIDINSCHFHADFLADLSMKAIQQRLGYIDATPGHVPATVLVLDEEERVALLNERFDGHDVLVLRLGHTRERDPSLRSG